MELNDILEVASKSRSSDIHLKAGLPPIFRRDSQLYPFKEAGRLTPEWLTHTAESIMTPTQQDAFQRNREIDMGYGVPGLGRFRLNVFQQRGTVGMVFRVIPMEVSNSSNRAVSSSRSSTYSLRTV